MHICHMLFRGALFGSTLALAASGLSAASQAAGSTYTVLHDFAGPPTDGANPYAEVTLDASGNIYGATRAGGANNAGAIFELATTGTESLLHSFGGTGDGSSPEGAMAIDANGNMYGTTENGGSTGNGVLYEFAADGTYTVLHSFTHREGSSLRGRLIQDQRGNLYGTAESGGVSRKGTVFKYSSKGKITVLHAFSGSDGAYPEGGVVRDRARNLYGVTYMGGAKYWGTVFKIARNGTFTTLYNFTGGGDGGFPLGAVAIARDGNIYGSTSAGGTYTYGTVFKLASDGTFTTLYSFPGDHPGAVPTGDMLLVGKNLYSTAQSRGRKGDHGVIYEVTATGRERTLHAFRDGGFYSAGLTLSNDTLYGTTAFGGNGDGVVFSLTTR